MRSAFVLAGVAGLAVAGTEHLRVAADGSVEVYHPHEAKREAHAEHAHAEHAHAEHTHGAHAKHAKHAKHAHGDHPHGHWQWVADTPAPAPGASALAACAGDAGKAEAFCKDRHQRTSLPGSYETCVEKFCASSASGQDEQQLLQAWADKQHGTTSMPDGPETGSDDRNTDTGTDNAAGPDDNYDAVNGQDDGDVDKDNRGMPGEDYGESDGNDHGDALVQEDPDHPDPADRGGEPAEDREMTGGESGPQHAAEGDHSDPNADEGEDDKADRGMPGEDALVQQAARNGTHASRATATRGTDMIQAAVDNEKAMQTGTTSGSTTEWNPTPTETTTDALR